jgi:hypothetical protein
VSVQLFCVFGRNAACREELSNGLGMLARSRVAQPDLVGFHKSDVAGRGDMAQHARETRTNRVIARAEEGRLAIAENEMTPRTWPQSKYPGYGEMKSLKPPIIHCRLVPRRWQTLPIGWQMLPVVLAAPATPPPNPLKCIAKCLPGQSKRPKLPVNILILLSEMPLQRQLRMVCGK